MDTAYFCGDAAGEVTGPHSVEDLLALAAQGVVSPETPVIREGDTSWRTWSEVSADVGAWRPPPVTVRAAPVAPVGLLLEGPPLPPGVIRVKPSHWALVAGGAAILAGVLAWPWLANEVGNLLPDPALVEQEVGARARTGAKNAGATDIGVIVGPIAWAGFRKAMCDARVTLTLKEDLFEAVDFGALARDAGDDPAAQDQALECAAALPESMRPGALPAEGRAVVRRLAAAGERSEAVLRVRAERFGREWKVLAEPGEVSALAGFEGRPGGEFGGGPMVLGSPEAGAAIRNYVEGRRRFAALVGQADLEQRERLATEGRGLEDRERLEFARAQEERKVADARREEETRQRAEQERALAQQRAEAEAKRKHAEEHPFDGYWRHTEVTENPKDIDCRVNTFEIKGDKWRYVMHMESLLRPGAVPWGNPAISRLQRYGIRTIYSGTVIPVSSREARLRIDDLEVDARPKGAEIMSQAARSRKVSIGIVWYFVRDGDVVYDPRVPQNRFRRIEANTDPRPLVDEMARARGMQIWPSPFLAGP